VLSARELEVAVSEAQSPTYACRAARVKTHSRKWGVVAAAAGAGRHPRPDLRGCAYDAGVHAVPRVRANPQDADIGTLPALPCIASGSRQPAPTSKACFAQSRGVCVVRHCANFLGPAHVLAMLTPTAALLRFVDRFKSVASHAAPATVLNAASPLCPVECPGPLRRPRPTQRRTRA